MSNMIYSSKLKIRKEMETPKMFPITLNEVVYISGVIFGNLMQAHTYTIDQIHLGLVSYVM